MATQSEQYPQLTFDMTVNTAREAYVEAQIIAYNHQHNAFISENYGPPYEAEQIHFYALDVDGEVVGGLTGRTHAIHSWLEIAMIWVREDLRHHGIGRSLMIQAEAEAMKRGCLYARLSTSRHQAPQFYEKLGYVEYGRLEDCPPGDLCFYYRKDLV